MSVLKPKWLHDHFNLWRDCMTTLISDVHAIHEKPHAIFILATPKPNRFYSAFSWDTRMRMTNVTV